MRIMFPAPRDGQTRPACRFRAAAALCCLVLPLVAAAQDGCPQPADVAPAQLRGLWRAEFEGRGAAGTVLLEAHREYAESLAGAINRDGVQARVVADLENGEFTMEESSDGVRISSTWLGSLVDGSCGREIRGQRTGGWDGTVRFVLRRADR
jgi:hypothetical protein